MNLLRIIETAIYSTYGRPNAAYQRKDRQSPVAPRYLGRASFELLPLQSPARKPPSVRELRILPRQDGNRCRRKTGQERKRKGQESGGREEERRGGGERTLRCDSG